MKVGVLVVLAISFGMCFKIDAGWGRGGRDGGRGSGI